MPQINKETTIREIIEKYPEKRAILEKYMQAVCFGCPMAAMETLEQAAQVHGADLEKLLGEINSGEEE